MSSKARRRERLRRLHEGVLGMFRDLEGLDRIQPSGEIRPGRTTELNSVDLKGYILLEYCIHNSQTNCATTRVTIEAVRLYRFGHDCNPGIESRPPDLIRSVYKDFQKE
jgi:hypothetical protein